MDVLLVPTVLQHYLVAEIEAEEKQKEPPTWSKNALNGRFTNFVNLLDMAAISVPSEIVRHPTLGSQSEGKFHCLFPAKLHSPRKPDQAALVLKTK